MPDAHMPDTLLESYREESGSLAATVARLRQENRELRDEIAALRSMAIDDANAKHRLRIELARFRAGGKA